MKPIDFIRSSKNDIDLIDEYILLCDKLLFNEPSIIIDVTNKLKNNIIKYAQKYCNTYSADIKEIYSRKELKREHWFVEKTKSDNQTFSTSGSSTGEPFSYGVYKKYIRFLEDESHYGMILDEFNINKYNPKILILKKISYNPNHKEFLFKQTGSSPYTLHTHKSIDSTRYFINFDGYMESPDSWFDELLKNIKDLVPFDIVMITGPIMNLLVRYMTKNNIYIKIGKLFSQTGEFMLQSDKTTTIEKGYADYVCDHMRCWDGGATFFTCRYNTYHLLDNLSWVAQGPDNKMISTDYFNMSAPFINYWNGDLCEIKDKYLLCECGRYYRPFKMLENRPFALKGPTKLTEIRQKINELIFKNKINQVQFENLSVSIYTNGELSEYEKKILDDILKDYKISYY